MGRPAEHFDEVSPPDAEPELTPEQLAEIEAAWEAEVLWIAKEHAEGRAKAIPWEQVRDELFGKPSK